VVTIDLILHVRNLTFTARECGVVICSVAYVCLSESLSLETSFTVCTAGHLHWLSFSINM